MSTNYVLSLQCKKALIIKRTLEILALFLSVIMAASWHSRIPGYIIVSALAITITLVIVTTLDTNKQSALGSEAKTVRE